MATKKTIVFNVKFESYSFDPKAMLTKHNPPMDGVVRGTVAVTAVDPLKLPTDYPGTLEWSQLVDYIADNHMQIINGGSTAIYQPRRHTINTFIIKGEEAEPWPAGFAF